MSYGVVQSQVPAQNDIVLGEGIWYVDYGEVSQAELGATREGSVINFDRVIKDIKYDGAYGSTKGLRRYELFNPSASINLLKVSNVTMGYGVPSTVTDKGDYKETVFDLNIEDSDYLINLTFVGNTHDGKAVIIKLFNVLNDGDISFNFKEKDELVPDMKYSAHYNPLTMTTPPAEMLEYD